MQGIVFDIKRFAVHDGPGIRTTIFLKGCPLRCLWCHNPESIDPLPVTSNKKIILDGQEFDRKEVVGTTFSVDQIMRVLKQDFIFMEESNGGVTFSGGEPTMQPGFLLEMLKACKFENLHTAVDTCGFAAQQVFSSLLIYTDLFLFDLKHQNSERHEAYTGKSNQIILDNLQYLLKAGKKVRLRIPVIPGFNDSQEDMRATLQLLRSFGSALDQIDLLPYHNIAQNKYKRFGINNLFKDVGPLNKEDLEEIKELFVSSGFRVKIGG